MKLLICLLQEERNIWRCSNGGFTQRDLIRRQQVPGCVLGRLQKTFCCEGSGSWARSRYPSYAVAYKGYFSFLCVLLLSFIYLTLSHKSCLCALNYKTSHGVWHVKMLRSPPLPPFFFLFQFQSRQPLSCQLRQGTCWAAVIRVGFLAVMEAPRAPDWSSRWR